MLKVTNIRKAFKDNEVLKGVDIEVNKGDVVTILGPSGSVGQFASEENLAAVRRAVEL